MVIGMNINETWFGEIFSPYSSMQVSLVERDCRTALHPLDWNIQRLSLESYPAKVGKYIGSLRVTTRHLPLFQKSYTTIYEENAI